MVVVVVVVYTDYNALYGLPLGNLFGPSVAIPKNQQCFMFKKVQKAFERVTKKNWFVQATHMVAVVGEAGY